MHLPRNGRHFEVGGYFESYINNMYYKSETFLMPNKTFVDIQLSLIYPDAYVPSQNCPDR